MSLLLWWKDLWWRKDVYPQDLKPLPWQGNAECLVKSQLFCILVPSESPAPCTEPQFPRGTSASTVVTRKSRLPRVNFMSPNFKSAFALLWLLEAIFGKQLCTCSYISKGREIEIQWSCFELPLIIMFLSPLKSFYACHFSFLNWPRPHTNLSFA